MAGGLVAGSNSRQNIGIGCGVGLGLLIAPAAGEETREQLLEQTIRIWNAQAAFLSDNLNGPEGVARLC